jgi:hypothetical protein|tara:strand:+ start:3158 stop:3547 length:390 start_codon:yes stop_codon:yes gene_type:complete
MVKNQLFRKIPEKSMVIKILNLYGINDIDDSHFFTKKNLIELNTVENLIEQKVLLENYYIPCKFKIYFNELNLKRCIVILRQLLKVHNYTLLSKEKNIKGVKESIYQVIPLNKEIELPTTPKKITISFE